MRRQSGFVVRVMTTINIKKYYPEAEPLKRLIKYYWVLESDIPITLNHKILPCANIDIIVNLLSPMKFEKQGVIHETPGNIYFSGLTSNHTIMRQQGIVLTIGVSFFPAGFYPFFKIPVSEFKNNAFGLDAVLNRIALELEEKLREAGRLSDKIKLLEKFFLEQLHKSALMPYDEYSLLNYFHEANLGVRDFCSKYGVHPRKLERLFNKYVGATPKQFLRLSRFQSILNRLMKTTRGSLTTLAHDFEFHDQAHFIRDFQSFTGSSPLEFLKEKRSFKQNMKIL